MKKHFIHASVMILLGFGLSACNYQKVPAPPPGYNNTIPTLNSSGPGMLHPTLVLQKTTPTSKLNSDS
jgi:hypothetical protein